MVDFVVPDLGVDAGVAFPALYAGRRLYPDAALPRLDLGSLDARIEAELAPLLRGLKSGSTVALTAGSRGIAHMPEILRACGDAIRRRGGHPFVVPAMGSHGGATAEGQRDVLADYGISRETVQMPIVSSMDVEQVGTVDDLPVVVSTTALAADHILLVNRIKPHTDFRGEVESGLAKICVIGLGKRVGAQSIHQRGTRGLSELMPRAARCIIEQTGKVLGGLAILENAYDETADLRGVVPEGIAGDLERELQARAGALIGRLPFDELDVLIVDEMGKNISGTGMDTNVLGRMHVPGVPESATPRVTAVVVLDLTDESHGNASGIGLADVTTARLVRKIDWQATYTNGLTSGTGGLRRNHLPNVMPSDRAAIAMAMRMCGVPDLSNLRVARIKSTLHAAFVEFSPTLLDAASAAGVEVTREPRQFAFDATGRLL